MIRILNYKSKDLNFNVTLRLEIQNLHSPREIISTVCDFPYKTRGHGGLTHHLHSEAPAGNRRMAMTFAKLRLIVFLRRIGLDWMPL